MNKKSSPKTNTAFLDRIFWALCSLKLAVIVISSLAASLAAATIIESLYDTPTAQYWVYRSNWFYGLLFFLGVNILFVAISRFPWKKRHIPFLLAHLGILTLLTGSWMTERFGIDGNLRVSEGEVGSVLDLENASLVVREKDKVYSVPVPWIPSTVEYRPLWAGNYGLPYDLKIDQFLTHADPIISFMPNPASSSDSEGPSGNVAKSQAKTTPAIRFRVVGGPMKITQEFWLWEGSPEWKSIQAGPARFSISGVDNPIEKGNPGRPSLAFHQEKGGSLVYVAQSSEGKQVTERLKENQIKNHVIHPGWKGNITITVLDWIADATVSTTYKPARVQYGNGAPSSAIHVATAGSVSTWLGLGDRAVLHLGDREVEIGYFPKRIVLPFSLRLDRFTIEHDQGTLTPASYASQVTAIDTQGQKEALISMNEPLSMGGFTIYQASYEDGEPRPVTSIFSVNRDPGRFWKYSGSLLIVLGAVLLFGAKYRQGKAGKKSEAPVVTEPLSEAPGL